jgi:hypothetical protein
LQLNSKYNKQSRQQITNVNIKIEKHLHTKNTHLELFAFFILNWISPGTDDKNTQCRKKNLVKKRRGTKPSEDTARWQPSTIQGRKPWKKPNLLAP